VRPVPLEETASMCLTRDPDYVIKYNYNINRRGEERLLRAMKG
jgi:hypothetical protein